MNKNKFGILSVLLAVVVAFTSCKPAAEKVDSGKKIFINEILMTNETNFQDDYGMHNAWIELFNKSYGNYNVANHMIKYSDTPGDTATYYIPKGDVLTLIPPRQHLLFWADNQPTRGTFHVSFTLNPEKNVWIAICDGGNKLLDEVTIPAGTLLADQSYALKNDGNSLSGWEIRGIGTGSDVTPSTNNFTLDKNEKTAKFQEKDKSGIGMTISAMAVVFTCLLLLYIIFRTIGKAMTWMAQRRAGASQGLSEEEMKEKMAKGATPGAVFAAIALAMHEMQEDVHDFEDTILTIHQVERRYSPWNSKIYSLRDLPKK